MPKIWINNTIDELQIDSNDELPEGYIKGRLFRSYYTNGKITIKLKSSEPIPEGFYKGRSSCNISQIKEAQRRQKISNSLKARDQEQISQTIEKQKLTKLQKYGSSGFNNIEKRKQTCEDRYNDSNYSNRELYKSTINSKSDSEKIIINQKISSSLKNYISNLSEEERAERYFDTIGKADRKKVSNIIRQNNLQKYGVTNTSKLEQTKNKMIITNLEKYGVPYFCMTDKCRLAIGGNTANSKPNKQFAKLLEENNIEYEQEFPLTKMTRNLTDKECLKKSKQNLRLEELLKNNFGSDSITAEFKLENYSYDFKVGKNLIEIDPWITHNSTISPFGTPKDKDYHYNKSKVARENGYRCIHIFDWDDPNKIINLLKNRPRVYARKCEVKEIVDKKYIKKFINDTHLQGYANCSIAIGLFYKNDLVSIMTFGKPRYNKKYEYELVRYCSSYNVVGGAEKLFSYFIKTYNPKSIISYCDLSKFVGDTYEKLGFTFKSIGISKHWYHPKLKRHITDNLLRQRGFDQLFGDIFGTYGKGTINNDLMIEHGFVEIYDAGQATYTLERENI